MLFNGVCILWLMLVMNLFLDLFVDSVLFWVSLSLCVCLVICFLSDVFIFWSFVLIFIWLVILWIIVVILGMEFFVLVIGERVIEIGNIFLFCRLVLILNVMISWLFSILFMVFCSDVADLWVMNNLNILLLIVVCLLILNIFWVVLF